MNLESLASASDASPAELADSIFLLETLQKRLAHPLLTLNPDREDWTTVADMVAEMSKEWENQVVSRLDALWRDQAHVADEVRESVGRMGLELAARLALAGQAERARVVCGRALTILPSSWDQSEFQEMPYAPAAFARYIWVLSLLRAGKRYACDAQIDRLLDEPLPPKLRERVLELRDRPIPMVRPPRLFSFCGIGTMLYGRRDRREDSAHISTLCITLFFFPLAAIASYRVVEHARGQYTFYGKERLSRRGRAWNLTLAAALLVMVTVGFVATYLKSDTHQSAMRLSQAMALEANGQTEEAMAGYLAIIQDYSDTTLAPVDRAVARHTELMLAHVERPVRPASVWDAHGALLGISRTRLSPHQKRIAANAATPTVRAWLGDLASNETPDPQARLALMSAVLRLDPRASIATAYERELVALARELVDDWPLDSLFLIKWLSHNPEALETSFEAVQRMLASPELLHEQQDLIQRLKSLDSDARHGVSVQMRQREQRGRMTQSDARVVAIDSIALSLARHDQALALIVARLLVSFGRIDEGAEVLSTVSAPGLLTTEALLELITLHKRSGALEQALVLSRHLIHHRLPQLLERRYAYEVRHHQLVEEAVTRVNNGTLSDDTRTRFARSADAEAAFDAPYYIAEVLRRDATLGLLRDEINRRAHVYEAVFLHGRILIALADQGSVPEPEQLFLEAEHVYRLVEHEFGGTPRYHFALGRLFLGSDRLDDAQVEFARATANESFLTIMEAARIHLDLEFPERARDFAIRAYAAARDDGERETALSFRFNMATDDDERRSVLHAAVEAVEAQSIREDMMFARYASQNNILAAREIIQARAARREAQEAFEVDLANQRATLWVRHFEFSGDTSSLAQAAHTLNRPPYSGTHLDGLVLRSARVHHAWARAASLATLVPLEELRPSYRELETLSAAAWNGTEAERFRQALMRHPAREEAKRHLDDLLTNEPNNTESALALLVLERHASDVDALEDILHHVRSIAIDARSSQSDGATARHTVLDEIEYAELSMDIERARERLNAMEESTPALDAAKLLLASAHLRRFNATRTTLDATAALDTLAEMDGSLFSHHEILLNAHIARALAEVRNRFRHIDAPLAPLVREMGVSALLLHRLKTEDFLRVDDVLDHDILSTLPELIEHLPFPPTLSGWLLTELFGIADSPHLSYAEEEGPRLVRAIYRETGVVDPSTAYLVELFPSDRDVATDTQSVADQAARIETDD